MVQLQFVTLDVLLACGVKPVHAAHLFAQMKDCLGMPPTTLHEGTKKVQPLRVYICAAAPPMVNGIDQHAMMCEITVLFDAVWADPRLIQGEEVEEGDPVVAPFAWKPKFGCTGTNKMSFEAIRGVYLDPQKGMVRMQYRGTGQCPLASANDEGQVAVKLKLRLLRYTDNWVELWHPRHADMIGRALDDGWSRLTDRDVNKDNHNFLTPEEYTHEFLLSQEYRLCNRHAYQEDEQDDFLRVDNKVGFQVLTSTYLKEIVEDLVALSMKKGRSEAEALRTVSLDRFSLKKTREQGETSKLIDARKDLMNQLAEDLSFLDDGSEDSERFVMLHYFGKKSKAIQKKLCAKNIAEQLIDLQEEIELGNASLDEWNECPVDPELAKSREAEERAKLDSMILAELREEAAKWGIDAGRMMRADGTDGKRAEMSRLILRAQGITGNRRRSATHGWCQVQADNTVDSPNFSVFQLTIRLQRHEEFYYLNPSLVHQPEAPLNETDDTDTRLHVWVQNTVHSLKDIDAAASSVSVKLHTAAFWIDKRLRKAMMHRRVLNPKYVWYPQLDVASKETLEVTILRLELINADTGLVRADYSLDGRCVVFS
jgi:hypothetical protein